MPITSMAIRSIGCWGRTYGLRKSLSALQEGFVYFSQNRGFHLWELDLEKQEVRLHYLIHQDLRGRLHYRTQHFPFYGGNLLEVLRTPYAQQSLQQMTVPLDRQFKDYLRQKLYYRHPKLDALQEQVYLKWKASPGVGLGSLLSPLSTTEVFPFYSD